MNRTNFVREIQSSLKQHQLKESERKNERNNCRLGCENLFLLCPLSYKTGSNVYFHVFAWSMRVKTKKKRKNRPSAIILYTSHRNKTNKNRLILLKQVKITHLCPSFRRMTKGSEDTLAALRTEPRASAVSHAVTDQEKVVSISRGTVIRFSNSLAFLLSDRIDEQKQRNLLISTHCHLCFSFLSTLKRERAHALRIILLHFL